MATFDALAPRLEFALLLTAFVGTTAAEGLTALWAAGSRRHWFWRALAVWAAVMLLVVLRIPHVTLVFSLLGPLIVAVAAMFRWYVWPGAWAEEGDNRHVRRGAAWQAFKVVALVVGTLVGAGVGDVLWPFSKGPVLLWSAILAFVVWIRWRRDPPPRVTVHLRDLLLAMAAIGLLLVWFQAARDEFVRAWMGDCIITATSLAVTIAMAWCTVFGPCRPVAVLLFLGSAAAAVWALPEVGYLMMGWYVLCEYPKRFFAGQAGTMSLFLGLVVAVVLTAGWLASAASAETASRWRTAARCLLAIGVVLAGTPLAMIYWQMYRIAHPPVFVPGTPNHFSRIVAIGLAHASPPIGNDERAALRRELANLLTAPNYVPFDEWRKFNFDDRDHDTKLQLEQILYADFLGLAGALRRESEAAIQRGDYVQAADWAVADIRLGTMLCRGGLEEHYRAGSAIRVGAMQDIIVVRSRLSRDKCLEVITALHHTAAELEPVAAVESRDLLDGEWPHRLRHAVRGVTWSLLRPGQERGLANQEAFSRDFEILLQVELAIRAFIIDRGEPPPNLDSLSPDYLPVIPHDPRSGRPLIYRPLGKEFVLYSVGEDGVDDGGRFTILDGYYSRGFDLDVETLTRH